ncbi:zinc ribbon domain-containing protein [Pseudoflavonifractor sp. AF19-9AC]|uniref:zinc ribbon domain-containing protein n=1 Tax=Pseudoflavonifractor sp. AF19-9AC TaxID=2292244 RepID=UPI000E4F471F|nr:zinc ribbon domain-containing protein [Pseudoflavonifractor sp. AF19-9AC]RHR10930.1 zinc ribbon domain-containing protein [Pseudoflavonifractor sp. AF19-9AC]
MNDENKEKKSNLWSIVGLVALILVLFVGVKLAFAALEAAIPQDKPGTSASQSSDAGTSQSQSVETDSPAPSYCPYCGEKLNDSFQWGQYCPFCGESVTP